MTIKNNFILYFIILLHVCAYFKSWFCSAHLIKAIDGLNCLHGAYIHIHAGVYSTGSLCIQLHLFIEILFGTIYQSNYIDSRYIRYKKKVQ